ncbi:MAG: 2-succinyl-5-enolpyruvyl-6-hydroxy-3-cyclohexene-1-carboxylic-acid synthase [bacterium]
MVEELVRNRVTYFCITPGSRSTPLTVAAARHPEAEKAMFYDERGAAFHALGYARATGHPAALVCTSGTAVANYYPAVIEASMDHIPLIILTADRPPELQETGANQTIRQPHVYSDYVRWRFNLPCPDERIPLSMVLTTIDQLVNMARRSPCGPVHLNCMFREPLAPTSGEISPGCKEGIMGWKKGKSPYTTFTRPSSIPDQEAIKGIARIISTTKKGLLVVGRLGSNEEIDAVRHFSHCLKWPVFADIASGLRIGTSDGYLAAYFDLMLLSERIHKEIRPDAILMIGSRITSKRFLEYVTRHPPSRFVTIENHSERSDPTHTTAWRIEADLVELLASLEERIEPDPNVNWREDLLMKSKGIGGLIQAYLADSEGLSELQIARLISQIIPEGHGLFLGNSMPIRDMDMFSDPERQWIRIGTNRGASGIDGNIASASGFAAGLKGPATLILGDLAFIHDLNSLSILNRMDQQVIIILINNRGGGIFSFLPISQFPDLFEPYFGTPHEYSFEHAARLFRIPYFHPKNQDAFIRDYRAAVKGKESAIVEVLLNREENKRIHQDLYKKIISFLEKS